MQPATTHPNTRFGFHDVSRATSLRKTLFGALLLFGNACGPTTEGEELPPCEQECQDAVAVRGLREMLKLIYNLTLQGKPVGMQDARTPCLKKGEAHVFGVATSNADQGATEVDLSYELDACRYFQLDDDIAENYDLTITGSIEQRGTIAVQPTATTALLFKGRVSTVSGSVYDPPIDYKAENCAVELAQNGNLLSGEWCGRKVGVDL